MEKHIATQNESVRDITIKGKAGPLHVDDGGTGGVPVVFIHAAAGSTTHWRAQLAHLRAHRRALAIDLRGHGRSDRPGDGDYRITSLADDVAAVVDRLGLERFVLVGHSMGGAVAAQYSAAHPNRLAGLFLLDPASDARSLPREQADGMMASLRSDAWADVVWSYWLPMLSTSRQEVKDRVLAGLRSTSQTAVAGPLGDLLTFDPVAALSVYRGPRLSAITAANEVPSAYHALVPDLPSRKLEGTGHWVHLDDPQLVNTVLDEFLATVK